ncbi:MAG: preQ(1) synthase [Candidatus Omnitrophota bacterium]
MKKKAYDGLQENVRRMKLPRIDVWENKYGDKEYIVRCDTSEFTCICPRTGLPDFAHIFLEYSPGRWCIELKSFKEYLLAYRDTGIFHEHAVNRILEDLVRSCAPRWMRLKGIFNSRGGIATTVEAEYRERQG